MGSPETADFTLTTKPKDERTDRQKANDLGTLAPTRVTHRVIDYLKEMFPPVLRLYLSFSDQRAKLGETITTRIPSREGSCCSGCGNSALINSWATPLDWSTRVQFVPPSVE